MSHPTRFPGFLAAFALVAPLAVRAQASPAPPPIRHVFVIVLENTGYDVAFGDKAEAPYLADSLPAAGALLRQYHGIGHYSLDNYIAMISGIAPNRDTQGDCGRYVEFEQTGMAPHGQPIGRGCVYPAHVQTIANQLEAKGLTWKAYMESMGRDPSREAATCGHPVIGQRDRTQGATVKDQYATKHNPFMYFHAIIDRPICQTNVVSLDHLTADLASAATTPNYVFISPDLCHDGHNHPCRTGEPGGMVSAGRFLAEWVPRITQSAAFQASGLLIVTFDEAAAADKTACCNEQTGPNTKSPGAGGPGGGRSGTVLVSPFIKPGTVSDVPYNHYAMLRSVEDIFGLEHLGFAGMPGLVTFGNDIYHR